MSKPIKLDIRINTLTKYLLSHKDISIKVVVIGKRRPNYSIHVFKKINNIVTPICVIGAFKGTFGFIFEKIYNKHYEFVKELFNFNILSELKFTYSLFEQFNKHPLFLRIFKPVEVRDVEDYYKENMIDGTVDVFNLIDPAHLPNNLGKYPYIKMKHKSDLLSSYTRFEILSSFEIYPDGKPYPFPVINLSNSNIIGQFQVDLINKHIYFENRDNMHEGLIIPAHNNKFITLTDGVIDMLLFEFINGHLDRIYGEGKELASDIINIPLKHINEKVEIFEMTYFI